MKAVVFEKYGSPSVLKVKDIEKPIPKANEVLIKVQAVAVGYGDTMVRKGSKLKDFNMPLILFPFVKLYFGIRKPKKGILGGECSGIVEAVGDKVSRFEPGDEVYAYIGQTMGGNAEYICMSENKTIAKKPKNMSFVEAASTAYGGLTASTIIKRLNIEEGQKILVVGASGGIGHFAVQYFKMYGAEVTGVCSTERVDLVKKLGADYVIDYTQNEVFPKNGEKYDVVFDVLNKTSFGNVKKSLKSNGR